MGFGVSALGPSSAHFLVSSSGEDRTEFFMWRGRKEGATKDQQTEKKKKKTLGQNLFCPLPSHVESIACEGVSFSFLKWIFLFEAVTGLRVGRLKRRPFKLDAPGAHFLLGKDTTGEQLGARCRDFQPLVRNRIWVKSRVSKVFIPGRLAAPITPPETFFFRGGGKRATFVLLLPAVSGTAAGFLSTPRRPQVVFLTPPTRRWCRRPDVTQWSSTSGPNSSGLSSDLNVNTAYRFHSHLKLESLKAVIKPSVIHASYLTVHGFVWWARMHGECVCVTKQRSLTFAPNAVWCSSKVNFTSSVYVCICWM